MASERPVPIPIVSGPTKSSGLEAGCFASSSDLQSFHTLKWVCLPPTGRSRLRLQRLSCCAAEQHSHCFMISFWATCTLFDRVSAFTPCSASGQGPEVTLGGWYTNCRVQTIIMASNAFDLNSDGAMIRLAERTTNQNAAFSNMNPTPLGRLQQRQHILHPRVFSIEFTPLSMSNGSPQCPPSPFAAFRVADRQLRCSS
jgi:hypothetical protein